MDARYRGKWCTKMLAVYYWSGEDCVEVKYNKNSKRGDIHTVYMTYYWIKDTFPVTKKETNLEIISFSKVHWTNKEFNFFPNVI